MIHYPKSPRFFDIFTKLSKLSHSKYYLQHFQSAILSRNEKRMLYHNVTLLKTRKIPFRTKKRRKINKQKMSFTESERNKTIYKPKEITVNSKS